MKLILRGKRLTVKFHFTRWGIVALVVVVALAAIGVTYAKLGGNKKPDGTLFTGTVVPITSCSDPFTWVVSNDDGHKDTVDPYGLIDPGDDGNSSEYDMWDDESSADPSAPPPAPGEECDRYDKDVAKTEAWLGIVGPDEEDPDLQYITVIVENAYPCYHPTVFFALECPGSAEGWITDIVIENDYPDELNISTSGIVKEELPIPIPSGEEVAGALHVHVTQEAEECHTYTFRVSITTECVPTAHGTAYAYYNKKLSTCFIGMTELRKPPWGWTNGPLEPGSYEFDMYAGAAKCNISKGRPVGTVTINYDGSTAVVTYNMSPGNFMTETQLYVGEEALPTRKNGRYTVSPGQYGNIHADLDYVTTDEYTITGLSGDIYVIAHAVACWFE